MKNYSKVEHMKFSIARLVLLLSMVIMVMLSGCSSSSETFTISGTITSGGSPLSGVTVTLSGDGSGVVTTDTNGNYSYNVSNYSTYSVTPSFAGYTFRPINRTVYIWGMNGDGINFSGIVSSGVSTTTHTVYLRSDGTVWAWGKNSNGQLGNGTAINSNIPVQVSGLSGMTAIAAGNNFTVTLKNDGTVWAWGGNSNGQLGNGTTTDSYIPVQVGGASGLLNVIGVAAGYDHAVAMKTDGTVWAWGGNSNGQLGNGTTTDSYIPVQVSGLTNIMAIAAGNAFTVALQNYMPDSQVWAWGSNNNGQLGNGTGTDSNIPVKVSGLSSTGAIGIAAGYDHAVAMRTDGTVWAWGSNDNGQLGNGTTTGSVTPVQVSGMSGVVAVAAGQKDTVAMNTDGTVWAWGSNDNGQLGNGTTTGSVTPVQAMLP